MVSFILLAHLFCWLSFISFSAPLLFRFSVFQSEISSPACFQFIYSNLLFFFFFTFGFGWVIEHHSFSIASGGTDWVLAPCIRSGMWMTLYQTLSNILPSLQAWWRHGPILQMHVKKENGIFYSRELLSLCCFVLGFWIPPAPKFMNDLSDILLLGFLTV